MKILIGNIILAFVILFNLVQLNAGVRYNRPPDNLEPNPLPSLIEDVPRAEFHVEDVTLWAGNKRNPWRIFKTVRPIADVVYHRFFQFNIFGTNLKFVFERDGYRRIINVVKLNGNKRPKRGSDTLKTYVATINGIQFLVHKTRSGYIVGASPPPNQVEATSEDGTAKIELQGPGARNKFKRLKIQQPPNL